MTILAAMLKRAAFLFSWALEGTVVAVVGAGDVEPSLDINQFRAKFAKGAVLVVEEVVRGVRKCRRVEQS